MPELKYTSYLTPAGRYVVAILTFVVAMSSIQVQSANAQEVLPTPPTWVTDASVLDETTQARGIVVPTRIEGELKKAQDKPKKVWNKINAPDLQTVAATSSEAAVKTVTVMTTAYTSDPAETDGSPFTTANGTQVYDGVVAANFLKFGTRIRIPDYYGDKVFVVHDRMNARYTQRVDVWMLKKADARQWGVRRIRIEVLP